MARSRSHAASAKPPITKIETSAEASIILLTRHVTPAASVNVATWLGAITIKLPAARTA